MLQLNTKLVGASLCALAVLLAWAGVLLLRPPRRDPLEALVIAIVPLALLASLFWFGVRDIAASVLVLIAVLCAAGFVMARAQHPKAGPGDMRQ